MAEIDTSDYHGLPAVRVRASDGATAIATRYGAHLVSWVPAGGRECLYVSEASPFGEGQPIRGGVPVIFPQFATYGPLPHHGFARTQIWNFVPQKARDDVAVMTFRLENSPQTLASWPHSFVLELTARLDGSRLDIVLDVTNTDDEPFQFNAALHTYLRISDLQSLRIEGLAGVGYLDRARNDNFCRQSEALLSLVGEVDRVYVDIPGDLRVTDPGCTFEIAQRGFPDAVIWNPGKDRSARLPDMPADGFLRMVCVEAAAVRAPIVLPPKAAWKGAQSLLASSS